MLADAPTAGASLDRTVKKKNEGACRMNTKTITCQCGTCENDNATATRVCGKCGKLVCEECFYECEQCNAICCCDCCDYHETADGDRLLCNNCWNHKCGLCGAGISDEPQQHGCKRCGRMVCADCAADCAKCEEEFCLECLDPCETCDARLCRDHKNFCDGCGDTACARCLTTASDENEYCPDCLPKHTGAQPGHFIRIRLSIVDNRYCKSCITTTTQMRCDLSYMLSEYLGTDVDRGRATAGRCSMRCPARSSGEPSRTGCSTESR